MVAVVAVEAEAEVALAEVALAEVALAEVAEVMEAAEVDLRLQAVAEVAVI